jgi:hypothetical protein
MALPPKIFDQSLIAHHLARRSGEDFVMNLLLGDLQDRLLTLIRDFPRALIIGPDVSRLPAAGRTAKGSFAFTRLPAFGNETELPPLPEGEFELIVSLLHLQAVNDVPGYLAQLRARLVPDGLLLVAALGGNTLTELREAFLAADAEVSGGASARVAPFIQVRDAGGLLQRAGLALPVADVDTHIVRYATPFALMAELKALGASNPLLDRSRRPATRALLTAAAEAYARQDADPDGRVRATLELIWLSGWVPHESQQQPLKPGSATVSMTRILGNKAK